MKKHLAFFVMLLILTGGASFAADSEEITIGIQGFGSREDQVAFFREVFMMEADAAGFKVTDQFDFKYADYGIRFDITPNTNVNEKQYIFTINLVRIRDLATMVTATYLFNELEEMAPYTQYLFFRLVANIPGYRGGKENTAWRNKWLYVRFSFDYPITTYGLQSDGLSAKIGVYNVGEDGELLYPPSPLDNKIIALPGATFGIEFQFLNWMSIEANARAALEELFGTYYINLAAGVELKFPIKVKSFMIEPYGAALYPILVPKRIAEYPWLTFGGGVQFCVKGGSSGAFFVDVNYMHSLGDAVMTNPFGEAYPYPPVIHYRRFLIGLGVGYKYGFLNRK